MAGLPSLSSLKDQIAERTKYLRDQERVITDTIESGNTQLMELNHEIALARQMLKDLKVDIRNARQDKRLLEDDITILQGDAGRLDPAFSTP